MALEAQQNILDAFATNINKVQAFFLPLNKLSHQK